MNWRDQAACLGEDVDRAFPQHKPDAYRFIQENCSWCPVRAQCAADRETRGDQYGIWGGVWYNDDHARTPDWDVYLAGSRAVPLLKCGHPTTEAVVRPKKADPANYQLDRVQLVCKQCDRNARQRAYAKQRAAEGKEYKPRGPRNPTVQ